MDNLSRPRQTIVRVIGDPLWRTSLAPWLAHSRSSVNMSGYVLYIGTVGKHRHLAPGCLVSNSSSITYISCVCDVCVSIFFLCKMQMIIIQLLRIQWFNLCKAFEPCLAYGECPGCVFALLLFLWVSCLLAFMVNMLGFIRGKVHYESLCMAP